jgi:hypothetical protein
VLLTLSTDHSPATDLGYLLHKHPDRCQHFKLSFGQASVFYPEANSERCTCALLLDIDPVGLVRGGAGIEQYVNNRPYVGMFTCQTTRHFCDSLLQKYLGSQHSNFQIRCLSH